MSQKSEPHHPCPECGSGCHVQTKGEAGYAKYWFMCGNREKCGWGSRTFRGPHRGEDEIDEIGFERHKELCRRDALEEADQKDTSEMN